ncbi:MAG TPA: glutathione S-transferase [Rhodocyclaceae bacterium]|nr:glutathione S-transferase [Rhodocyclaceae bacterium]HMV63353.1 glutathione S-transferase [Rhodocyclaceae bacterium]HNA67343.1 glutathione S-transferase [Rhodocyclaceae bacterium]HNB63284.1 glutathione S-transferase [Rhodocyclaceae bacterium]
MNTPAQPIRFHRFATSGHSHRAELMLSLLGLPVEPIDVDLAGGAQKTPAYLAMNCFGQVPVIQDGDVTVADSNAILVYLASVYDDGRWLPRDPAAAAQVQRWLSVAAGQLAYGPCAARLVTVFGARFNADEVIARAHALFKILDAELATRAYLTGDAPTIADVALYSYTAHAPEGNVSLDPYPHIRAWLARIEALPGFVPMPATAAGLRA